MKKIQTLILLGCFFSSAMIYSQQLPLGNPHLVDLTDLSMGTKASTPNQVAESWYCQVAGDINTFVVWGVWYQDLLDQAAIFHLKLCPEAGGFPGSPIWEYDYAPGQYPPPAPTSMNGQWWYDPLSGYSTFPGSFTIYNYQFPVNPTVSCIAGMNYWLSISVTTSNQNTFQFGWVTGINHYIWPATWSIYGSGNWQYLFYPFTHPYGGQIMDFALDVLGTVNNPVQACCFSNGNCTDLLPATCIQQGGTPMGSGTTCANSVCPQPNLDFGDAPDPTYPTLLANNGARHTVVSNFHLGATIDAEPNGLPSTNSLGDDQNGLDDEDGVYKFSGDFPGMPMYLVINASAAGYLDAWMDYNNDGDWNEANEQIFQTWPLISGYNYLSIITPPDADTNGCFSRFRFSSQGGLPPTGPAGDGEVEDHLIEISPTDTYKWIQNASGNFPGLHAHDAIVNNTTQQIFLADDWMCYGGDVTKIQWFGAYESAGAGISSIRLKVLPNQAACLPGLPAYIDVTLPLGSLNETFTGVYTSDNLPIYSYTYTLPQAFQQTAGSTYWLALSSNSVNIQSPAIWRWCEAFRSHRVALCAAANMTLINGNPTPWTTLGPIGGKISEMAFIIYSNPPTPVQPHDFFIQAGDWINTESWHNWIGGSSDSTKVQLLVSDPDHQISNVTFFYSYDLTNWNPIGMDTDGTVTSAGLSDTVILGDGWLTMLQHNGLIQALEPLYFKVIMDLITSDMLEYTKTEPVYYDPTPPNKFGLNFGNYYEMQTDVLTFDAYSTGANIQYIFANVDPKETYFNKGIPDISQYNQSYPNNGNMFCAPTASAACLKYFEPTHPQIAGGLDDQGLTEALSWEFETDPIDGSDIDNIGKGLDKWISDHGGGFSVRSLNNYMPKPGGGWDITSNAQTFDLMKNELERCQDVIATMTFIENGQLGPSHTTTFNSIDNEPDNGMHTVGFMDPGTGEKETGTMDPSSCTVTGYADNVNSNPPYANKTARIGHLAIVCPMEQSIVPTGGKIKWGPDPPVDTFILHLPRWYFFRIICVDQDGFSARKDIVVKKLALDYGDAPDSYATLYASDGPRHELDGVTFLGDTVDYDSDGQPTPGCNGDDLNNVDDEDGVIFNWPLHPGNPCMVTVKSSVSGAFLNAWIDFDHSGTFSGASEQIFSSVTMLPGNNYLYFYVPPNANPGNTCVRFRLSTVQGLNPCCYAPDGEVEDYLVDISTTTGIKWQQPYNPTLPGLHDHDYMSGQNTIGIALADDWLCNGGVVTDLHWWGNYETNGTTEIRGSGINHFHLAIHANTAGATCLPAEPPLWSADITLAEAMETTTGVLNNEAAMIYEYSWYLTLPFEQVQGNRYWLEIQAVSNSATSPPLWRWQEAFRSDMPILCGAATRTLTNGSQGPWSPIAFPSHPFENLAFKITSTQAYYDYGDAPNSYSTLLAANGARHNPAIQAVFMGLLKDTELNGFPSVAANGDDLNNLADEDGVTFNTPLVQGQNASVTIVASIANVFITGWVDFNADGDWNEQNEQIINNLNSAAGPNVVIFPVPNNAITDTTYARFRISTMPGLSFTGLAPNGEVEDYRVIIEEPAPELDFGDAPDTYSTLLASNGPRHIVNGIVFMGNAPDTEANGFPSVNANGDDLNNLDDEDGVTFNWPLNQGNPSIVTVNSSLAGAFLTAWVDFNADGDFGEAGEKIFSDQLLAAGNNHLTFQVPANAVLGNTYARFRICTQQGLSYTGQAPNGEVEDYLVEITALTGIKWQQPYNPTLPGLHDHDYISGQNTMGIALADDWLCNGGVVTDLHWWGNYETNGTTEIRGSGINHFHLAIHANTAGATCLPAEPPLWSADITLAEAMETTTGVLNNEAAMIYEYSWYLTLPFEQVQGTRYWLEIQAVSNSATSPPLWRWQEAFRSDMPILCGAATRTLTNGSQGPWSPITFATHPFENLAFKITSTQAFYDYGDAPNSYSTLLAANGARHNPAIQAVFMGLLKDTELNGFPSVAANGDDLNNLADEDGVTFNTPLVQGQNASVTIVASIANVFITGWVDFNADGDWNEQNEQIINNLNSAAGPNVVIFPVPNNAITDTTYARFRISTMPGLSFTGLAPNGEVEDYRVIIEEPQPEYFDWGDAPDPGYPTLALSNGANHALGGALKLGNLVDQEANGLPHPAALGDDQNNNDDEDGVLFTSNLIPGNNATLIVNASAAGFLQAWVDFNADGDWSDNGEQVFTNQAVVAGNNNLGFAIPNNAHTGKTFARFRVCTAQNIGTSGTASDGEVEDYRLFISQPGATKMHWSQPPDLNPNGHAVSVDLSWTPTADDFLCTQTGTINHIRTWHNFADDSLSPNGPGSDTIRLLIRTDIPESNNSYSKPGDILWQHVFEPGDYNVTEVCDSIPAWWYDPATQVWQPNNNLRTFRFDFPIVNNAFNQTQGTVYWLEVQYLHPDWWMDNTLGWRTTPLNARWNDDAVWFNGNNPNFPNGYVDHHYMPGHPSAGQSFDMAFAIFNAAPAASVSGTINYGNAALTPMNNTKIYLRQNNIKLDSTITNTSGYYSFTTYTEGLLNLTAKSTKPWGGANSTDALIILKHYVQMSLLTGLYLKAANVDGSAIVNTIDALMTARRYIGYITSFPVGDWAFENPSLTMVTPGTYTVNLLALCYGDVNGSYDPPMVKQPPSVTIIPDGAISTREKEMIRIPVLSGEDRTIGAISLSIGLPEKYSVNKVSSVLEYNGGFYYHQDKGQLTISWYSLVPVSLYKNQKIFDIELVPGSPIKQDFNFEALSGSVIADDQGVEYTDFMLFMPEMTLPVTGNLFSLGDAVPNPLDQVTRISFTLSEDATVSLSVNNSLGERVDLLLDHERFGKGRHTITFDCSNCPQGVYYYSIEAVYDRGIFQDTKRLILVK